MMDCHIVPKYFPPIIYNVMIVLVWVIEGYAAYAEQYCFNEYMRHQTKRVLACSVEDNSSIRFSNLA